MLTNVLTEKKMSLSETVLHSCMFGSLGGTERLLLATMPCDRYLAICNPLHYTAIMNWNIFPGLEALFWITGFAVTLWSLYWYWIWLSVASMGLPKAISTLSYPLIVMTTFCGILAIMYVLLPANNSLNLNNHERSWSGSSWKLR